ncbi:MAG: T9SS type A sorting domain-containing protein [Ignavibacteriaceae bacterium]|jgi:hypothetical protein|nr:T9SS type A sorting domain-containing protein [Ignavibacteriaceae bacterium]
MKKAILLLTLLLSTHSIFGMDGEIWFYIDDNTPNVSYYVKAVRISNNDPLFGANFLEVDTYNYNVVISDYDAVYQEPVGEFEKLRGFNFLRDIGAFPAIGEGKIRFEIYRNNVLIFKFSVDLVHSNVSPDLTFKYYYSSNTMIGKGNGPTAQTIQIYNNGFINCWDLLGETRNISSYVNQVTLTNLIAGSVESNIKTTFNTAPMGFPYNNVQLGVQYNPGTTVSLWRGVYYNISASHTSYVKNGVNYNFRNWNNYLNFQSSTALKIESNTSELKSLYYQTQPLTVFNNLEGGSTNNNYNIIWLNPDPDITTVWQYGTAYNLFGYSPLNPDIYNIEATSTFQNLNTTWWFYKWNDGSTNRLKQNLHATSPTNLTAYYKGNLRSNDQHGISSNSQRKMVRTDNGIYHLVYESMGNVYYTHSLTSNFDGSWSQEELLRTNAKNPAIEYHVNNVKIVFEFYDPVYGDDAIIYLSAYAPNASGVYTQVVNECEEVANFPVSYFGNAKPVISYNQVQLFIAYRKNSTEGLKERTKWFNINTGLWNWSNEAAIPGTNLYSINPSVVESYAHIHLVYESQNSIMYKYAVTESYSGPWQYDAAINVSTGSGFKTNNNPNISIAGSNNYVIISWTGIYTSAMDKVIAKEHEDGLRRYAAVVKAGLRSSWGGFSSFSNNVNYTNNNSISAADGSILTWSEMNGQYSKYVKRNSDGTYGTITNLTSNGIQTMASNADYFSNIEVMVFNNTTTAPYLLNKCTNNFSLVPLAKAVETETIDISYGRSGVVEKNNIEFLFNIGEVMLDGQAIRFVNRIDTLPVNSVEELNEFARTESFSLNSQSELIFSNYYYVVNPSLADSVLTDIFNVNFKCELVNSATNQVVGTFDNITYNKSNVQIYANPSYLIDCFGIESGSYYLKLTTAVNDSVNLFISDIQRDDIVLEKSNLLVRNFNGADKPTLYELSQNYPNPFNPSTTIRYQTPQDGIVTLRIYDILGAVVATLINEEKAAGKYEVNFDASKLSSGVYIYKIQAGGFISSKKMILIK